MGIKEKGKPLCENINIKPLGEMQVYDYGKFAHIMDPEGNKIELWEAID